MKCQYPHHHESLEEPEYVYVTFVTEHGFMFGYAWCKPCTRHALTYANSIGCKVVGIEDIP